MHAIGVYYAHEHSEGRHDADMKTVTQKDTVYPYKVLRKATPQPYLLAGIAFLLYGLLRPMAGVVSYAIGALIAVGAYFLGRGIWPDKRVEVPLKTDTGDKSTDQLLEEARGDLVAIQAANDRIADEGISASIDSIKASALKILARLEEDTALYSQLRTFLRYYLPTTRKLLETRAAIEQGNEHGESARKARERTDRVLPEIESAFAKQLEALDKHKYLDIQVEMDVLEGMLKSDGLTDSRAAEK